MKKLKLLNIQTGSAEVLSREQLKNVLGGQVIPLSGGAGSCSASPSNCPDKKCSCPATTANASCSGGSTQAKCICDGVTETKNC